VCACNTAGADRTGLRSAGLLDVPDASIVLASAAGVDSESTGGPGVIAIEPAGVNG
jgi:hypothetical protein